MSSRDGTALAFDRVGSGPPLILVDGALCYRASGPMGPIAALLAPHFTVYTYDRRGRGESEDTQPYAIERELEDIEALVEEAGGHVSLFGISSGAALALEATARLGPKIEKLALYEAPFIVDGTRAPLSMGYLAQMESLVAAERRADALRLFMTTGVGLHPALVFVMRLMPSWRTLERVAHTLVYDTRIMVPFELGEPLPADRWKGVTVPTFAIDGGKSPAWMRNGMRSLSEILPSATYHTLPGQTHMVKASVLVPVLVELLKSEPSRHHRAA